MQGVLKKGAKVAGTITILKNPITWMMAGSLLLLTSIFGFALFVSMGLAVRIRSRVECQKDPEATPWCQQM